MKRLLVAGGIAALALLLAFVVGHAAAGCGQHLFPDCTPAQPCPPCTGYEKAPDPCVGRARDAGGDR